MAIDESTHAQGHLRHTGVPNLDLVLGGGIHPGAIVVALGAPGAGKTTLAHQLAFHAASQDENVLVFTGFSEPHDKLVAHMRGFEFFHLKQIGTRIQFANLLDLLQAGMAETEEAILSTVRRHRATLVIFDGFQGMRRRLMDEPTPGQFLYSLGSKLALFGATTVVAMEGDIDAPSSYPELTVADVILALRRDLTNPHHRRTLDVIKARGSAPLAGSHPYTITAAGITVYPRFESIVMHHEPSDIDRRVMFGIPDIDTLVGGGLTAGTMTLIAGSPGTGKTLLGLHLLIEGARRGERGLFVGFMESPDQLRHQARTFGLEIDDAEARDLVRLCVLPAYDLEPDMVAALLRDEIETGKVQRLVIDSVSELEHATAMQGRSMAFMTALATYLRGRDITSYETMDIQAIVGPDLTLTDTPISVMAENLVLLRQVEYAGELRRLFSVLKVRFSDFDRTIHEYIIHPERGIEMIGPAPLATGLRTGIAQPIPDADSRLDRDRE